ncbi:23S rRNA (guanosine(2251)-2'-O)-methyltransferase RlmB [Cupriavidus sp. D39]|uniref:23S rRNA (guanosine(2251)-2'-O)-methyltransferase RlmB n=1 Tax=Cupriavidus sp. D39 TaxID=2997877 RepID=UPI0022716F65|nr:23S rRNA (guanosine(2251)-2'-O)-methyltransferase RlmB [Cupriavidus sp. D39]MCY0855701.1 23S rRNA (guanosine(2251)-2'-O)-methyltransferase RlmB [Cupriavidus sp. D39]
MAKQKLLIGFHAVTARLRQDAAGVTDVYVESARRDRRMQDFIRLAESLNVRLHPVDAERLRGMAGTDRHQGVVARAEDVALALNLDELLDGIEGTPLLLVLDGVTDPHNLGACLRVADGAGAHAVIAPKDRSVGLNTTVAKVASGAAETIPYITVTNLARTLRELAGTRHLGDRHCRRHGKNALRRGFQGPGCPGDGRRRRGMRRLTRETCDELVGIPMAGGVESLNVSVASGVCLYEAVRQRRLKR